MPAQRKTTSYIDWDAVPLGRRPDAEIAEKYGIEEKAVRNRRIRLGIRAFNDPVKPKGTDYDRKALREKQRREELRLAKAADKGHASGTS